VVLLTVLNLARNQHYSAPPSVAGASKGGTQVAPATEGGAE